VKEIQRQIKLPGVPMAKQGREVAPQWEWTEAAVWPERMLATLERGIQGGKWYSLDDKVWKRENLQRAVAQEKAVLVGGIIRDGPMPISRNSD